METRLKLSYPFEHHPEPGTTLEAAPGVHWARMPLPLALDHVNLWLLDEGDDEEAGWTIIDTGLALDAIKRDWETILATHGKPVRRVIATHCHPDHLGLARWLQDKLGVPLWATQGEMLTASAWYHQLPGHNVGSMVALFRRHGLDEARCEALASRGPSYRTRVDGLPVEYHRLAEGDLVRIGARDWRVIVGYGHSPEHASLHCPELGVLISGDMLLPRISTNVSVLASNPEDDPLQDFLDSLDRLTALPPDTLVLPSHGRPFRGVQARVAQLHAHHRDRLDALEAACAIPQTACDLIPVLFSRELDGHQIMFAMGEAIAHLNCLKHAGKIRPVKDGSGVIRFVKSS